MNKLQNKEHLKSNAESNIAGQLVLLKILKEKYQPVSQTCSTGSSDTVCTHDTIFVSVKLFKKHLHLEATSCFFLIIHCYN